MRPYARLSFGVGGGDIKIFLKVNPRGAEETTKKNCEKRKRGGDLDDLYISRDRVTK